MVTGSGAVVCGVKIEGVASGGSSGVATGLSTGKNLVVRVLGCIL